MSDFSLLLISLLAMAAAQPASNAVTGTWDVAAKFSIVGGPADGRTTDMKAEFRLTQKGTAVTGTFVPYEGDGKTPQPAMPIVGGRAAGSKITFSVKQDADTSLSFALTLEGGHLKGEATPSKEVNGGGKLVIKVDATRRK